MGVFRCSRCGTTCPDLHALTEHGRKHPPLRQNAQWSLSLPPTRSNHAGTVDNSEKQRSFVQQDWEKSPSLSAGSTHSIKSSDTLSSPRQQDRVWSSSSPDRWNHGTSGEHDTKNLPARQKYQSSSSQDGRIHGSHVANNFKHLLPVRQHNEGQSNHGPAQKGSKTNISVIEDNVEQSASSQDGWSPGPTLNSSGTTYRDVETSDSSDSGDLEKPYDDESSPLPAASSESGVCSDAQDIGEKDSEEESNEDEEEFGNDGHKEEVPRKPKQSPGSHQNGKQGVSPGEQGHSDVVVILDSEDESDEEMPQRSTIAQRSPATQRSTTPQRSTVTPRSSPIPQGAAVIYAKQHSPSPSANPVRKILETKPAAGQSKLNNSSTNSKEPALNLTPRKPLPNVPGVIPNASIESADSVSENVLDLISSEEEQSAVKDIGASAMSDGDGCDRNKEHVTMGKAYKSPDTMISKATKKIKKARCGYKCWKCVDCFLSSKKSVHKHFRKKHVGLKPFQCEACLSTFTTLWWKNHHEKKTCATKPLRCRTCGLAFERWSQFQKHRASHSKTWDTISVKSVATAGESVLVAAVTSGGSNAKKKEKQPHTCKVCGKVFKLRGFLRRHYKKHPDMLLSACFSEKTSQEEKTGRIERTKAANSLSLSRNECNPTDCTSPDRLKGQHRCDECRSCFSSAVALEVHRKCHRRSPARCPLSLTGTCKICGKEYKHKISLYKHRFKHLQDLACVMCGAEFPSIQDKFDHACFGRGWMYKKKAKSPDKKPPEIKSVKSGLDAVKATAKTEKQDGKAIKSATTPHDDVTCMSSRSGTSTAKPQTLTDAKAVKSATKPLNDIMSSGSGNSTARPQTLTVVSTYMCVKCGKDFSTELSLSLHMKSIHGREDVIVPKTPFSACCVCLKMFRNRTLLHKHQRGHPEIYCSACHILFDKKIERQKHVCSEDQAEIGEKPSKIMKRAPSKLKAKDVLHVELRKYLCKICGVRFILEDSLHFHRLCHSEELQCVICGMTFSDSERKLAHKCWLKSEKSTKTAAARGGRIEESQAKGTNANRNIVTPPEPMEQGEDLHKDFTSHRDNHAQVIMNTVQCEAGSVQDWDRSLEVPDPPALPKDWLTHARGELTPNIDWSMPTKEEPAPGGSSPPTTLVQSKDEPAQDGNPSQAVNWLLQAKDEPDLEKVCLSQTGNHGDSVSQAGDWSLQAMAKDELPGGQDCPTQTDELVANGNDEDQLPQSISQSIPDTNHSTESSNSSLGGSVRDMVTGLVPCSNCSRLYATAAEMELHVRPQLGQVFTCIKCCKQFTIKCSFFRHLMVDHSND